MTLFDRFVIGTFAAACCVATGFVFSVMTVIVPGGTAELLGPIFHASLYGAGILFVLGFVGRVNLIVDMLSVLWKPIKEFYDNK